MATLDEIEKTYDWMTPVFLMSLGSFADITCAMFNGDFSLTLDEAQQKKHEFIRDSLGIKPGQTILDIGCGRGPLLNYFHAHGYKETGVTLSPEQVKNCTKHNLNAVLTSWQNYKPAKPFDGISSVGAFEHFCSIEEYKAGKQDEIYTHFFRYCHENSVPGSALFLQTMTWGGKGTPRLEDVLNQEDAEKGSYKWHLNRLTYFYPGSRLPDGVEQLKKCAAGYYEFVSHNDGRKDYIETMKRRSQEFNKFSFKKRFFKLKLLLRLPFDKSFRYQIDALRAKSNQRCFEEDVMGHTRSVRKRIG